MKVLVVGNCQARSVVQLLATACPEVQTLEPIILQLARGDQASDHAARMAEADIILAQVTADDYAIEHLRASAIKAECPAKSLIWLNVFYAGQHPFLRYVTHLAEGRVQGPLDVYHDLSILARWLEARGLPPLAFSTDIGEIRRQSLSELVERERICDVGVSDLIVEGQDRRRLFFTFNHPVNWLLSALCERIVAKLGRPARRHDVPAGEFLDRIVPPSTIDEPHQRFMGSAMDLAEGGRIRLKARQLYDASELEEACFAAYDHQRHLLTDPSKLRLTPAYDETPTATARPWARSPGQDSRSADGLAPS